jgi:uncharacterized protein (TIGR03435 family)
VALGLYAIGAIALLVRLAVGTLYAHRLRRSATLRNGRATSDRCAAPMTIGWLRPMLVLPTGWHTWSSEKLALVLTHEAEHARRRDPLVQWLALLNRAVFWFHPLAWWLERRLASLAEESCDAVVLAAGHSAKAYSECLIDLARAVAHQGQRIRAIGVAMPGSGLHARLRSIMSRVSAQPLSRWQRVCTATFCAASTALFASATLTPRTSSVDVGTARVQQTLGAIPKFDVVSVKPCDPNNPGLRGTRGGGAGAGASPGRLTENCLTLMNLMQNAYIRFANARGHDAWRIPDTPIEGGPEWITHDPYLIEATADASISQEMMRGPMLQALLEDRFHLKLHRETRQGPIYELVVAASGSKLKPATPGVCVQPDWTVFPAPTLPDGQHYCGITGGPVDENGHKLSLPLTAATPVPILAWDDEAISLDDLASDLLHLDRPVVNKTGIPGLFILHLTHRFVRADPESASPVGDAHTAAVELKAQLGLELKPSTGPRDFLVIDHVERPVPNEPIARPATRAATGPGTR